MPPRVKPAADHKPGQSSRQGYKFQKASDVRQSLKNPNETTLVEALTALRNQLTIKHDEHVAADDERLLLVKSWLDIDQGAQDVFEVWEKTNTRQLAQLSLVLSVFSSLVALLSTQYTYHAYATPIIRSILSPQWSLKLNSYMSTSHNELLLVTLKLYYNLSSFAGGRERRAILDAFPWELKFLPKLLHMRRRSKGEDNVDILARPDIRTLYVLFLFSFVDATTSSAVKTAFLDQRRDSLLGVFKGLAQDDHIIVRRVLECCWTGIWCDLKVKRTVKIGLFNEQTIHQVLRLYDRNVPEGEGQDSAPADVAHHFLLAICTRPGTGICFKDRSWYPREDEDQLAVEPEDEGGRRQGGRIYNKILAGVLKGLKVNEDARQQELALRILEACPELVAGYWHGAALTLEPRLSSKWIANIAFFGLVLSLPIPHASFLLPNSDLYRPTPPALNTILENVLPSVNTKVHLSRGLQAAAPLVQHCAALALAKSLAKLGAVSRALRTAAGALEEDDADGQWTRRLRELLREAARRVPEFQVVVAFAQQKTGELAAAADAGALKRGALLAESAQRLLWLYHEHLPALVAETRFDVGKLLVGVQEGANGLGPHPGLLAVRQLHVLRLLKESEDFSWSGKSGSRGNLLILLRLYTKTNHHAMKSAVANLLRQTLSTTAAFQHDADEVDLWLRALPTTQRTPDARAPDGTPLTDEAEAVLTLLDDCLQRCIKTPYRYLEELQGLCTEEDARDPSALPSPMLITLLEQAQAKVAGNLLSPSDVLAVIAYARRVVCEMAGKLPTLRVVNAVASRVGAISFDGQHLGECVLGAVMRDVQMLRSWCQWLTDGSAIEAVSSNVAVVNSLEQEVFESIEAKEQAAYRLIDALRFNDPNINSEQFGTLLSTMDGLPSPVLDNLLEIIPTNLGVLRGSEQKIAAWSGTPLNFTTLFLHALARLDKEPSVRSLLVRHLPTASANAIKHVLRLVDHRLVCENPSTAMYATLVELLGDIMKRVKSVAGTSVQEVKEFVFRLEGMYRCCRATLPEAARKALSELLAQLVKASDPADVELIAPFTSHWLHELSSNPSTLSDDQLYTALAYLPYTPPSQTLALISALSTFPPSENLSIILDAALTSLTSLTQLAELVDHLPTLLRLRALVPESAAWPSVLARALEGCLPAFYAGRTPLDAGSLQSAVDASAGQWGARRGVPDAVGALLGQEVLESEQWTGDVLERLVYALPGARPAVVRWLRSGKWRAGDTRQVVRVVRALLDIPGGAFGDADEDLLGDVCEAVLGERWGSFEREARGDAVGCLKAAVDAYPALRPRLASVLQAQMKKREFASPLCALVMHVDSSGPLGSAVVDKGLKWATDVLSGKIISEEDRELLTELQGALDKTEVKPGYAESVISVGIQNWLADGAILAFMDRVIGRVSLKPVTVNRYIQNVIQHPKFQAITRPATEEFASIRAAVVGLLHKLFQLHPMNSCQPSHVEPLLVAYGGTMSPTDRLLLSIFQLFERTRKASVVTLLSCWSPAVDSTCASALEAIQGLDPVRVMQTCVSFSQYYSGSGGDGEMVPDERVYDPVFVILLFAQMLVEGAPTTALAWVQMFRTNVASLLIRALSSHVGEVRALAMAQVAGLYVALQDADMQERAHVLHILDLLKDTYESNSAEELPLRLPAYATLHLAHALRGVFYPAASTYPLTARFLLQRAEFDAGDVPLLYSTLYSAEEGWRRERAWMVRFLADGMVGRREWRVLKRRHTWDLVASIFQSEERDLSLRRGVLEFLANLTCNKAAATSLVLGSALLSWIELQLHTVKPGEALAWAKVLENVVAVVDLARLETASAGEWRAVVSRCLLRLLSELVCDRDVLVPVVRVVLRLSVLAPPPEELDALVTAAVRQLRTLEKDIRVDAADVRVVELSDRLHTSTTLWRGCETSPLATWGFCVESLWRAAMAVEERSAAWDALTSRLLVWRAVAGEEKTAVGEWARKEVVSCIGS